MKLKCHKINGLYVVISIALLMVLFNWYSVILIKYNPVRITDVTDRIISQARAESAQLDSRNGTRSMKYILQWTLPNTQPFVFWGKGQEGFLKRKCKVNECFVTNDRELLKDITHYDAIAFHGPEITRYQPGPRQRGAWQKYVYVSIESSHYYPICDKRYDGFFNWTWTYRLDSDIPYAYISIRDIGGNVISPRDNMTWIDVNSMKNITEELKRRLSSKKKGAAWFVSNCQSKSKREIYVNKLKAALKQYDLDIDIYGKCGNKHCSVSENEDCLKMIETDYYFYMSMENSFSEDYVTEKLLTALQNYAVPVVYGGANYQRFMPDGIYLNAMKMSPVELAKEMHDIIQDKERYYSFFKWRNHYSYHAPSESPETDEVCNICSMLHDDSIMRKTTMYPEFRKWWNGTLCGSAGGNKFNVWLIFGPSVISLIRFLYAY